MSGPKKKTIGRTEAGVFCLCLLIGIATLWHITADAPVFANEAVIRAGVGHDLLDGHSRGRQGLIGSCHHAPLPTLLALPLLQLPPPLGGQWSLAYVAIFSAALLGAALSAWLRHCGISTFTRLGIVLAVIASPFSLRAIILGQSDVLFAFLIFTAGCLLIHWWQTEALRSLAYLAVVTALTTLVRFQATTIILLVLAVVILHLLRKQRPRHYAEATLIIFLTPALYIIALWFIANWLIMGNPFFFLRGLKNTAQTENHILALLTDSCAWTTPLLLCLLALCARLTTAITTPRLKRAAAFGLLLISLLFWRHNQAPIAKQPSPADRELPGVLAEIGHSFSADWLIVSGYRGYLIQRALPANNPGHLYHTLNLHPEQMLRNTHGKRAYILVPAPTGPDRWEDINLKYPGLHAEPTPFTVYEKTWKHWTLWRVVRMDETDRK